MVRFVLMVAMAALTSFGTTSPRYMRQTAMYLPWRGCSEHRRRLEGRVGDPATESRSWYAFGRDDRRG